MPPKRRQCLPKAGLVKRLNAVGASIENDAKNKMLGEIVEHLKTHPDEVEPCYRLLMSGMVIRVSGARDVAANIPECTTKLGLVSQGLKRRTLAHVFPSLDMAAQAKMNGQALPGQALLVRIRRGSRDPCDRLHREGALRDHG